MANAAIGYLNLADDATITASTAGTLSPASNLQQADVGRSWQGGANGSDWFVADLLSAVNINAVAIMGLVADTIRVRISSIDTSGATGDLYDSGETAVDQTYLQQIIYLASAVSARYVRIDLTKSGAQVEAGRLFIGSATSFSINYAWGWQRGRSDRSIRNKTDGGQTVIRRRARPRTLDITFNYLSDAEATGIITAIDEVNGLDIDVLLMTDPASSNMARDTVWGLITELTAISSQFIDINSKQYKIEQRL